ncbi:MAG: extracellular solute-binding protein [Planctomycetota bacterium]
MINIWVGRMGFNASRTLVSTFSSTLLLVLTAGLFFSCSREKPDVVIYCALDQNFSEPLLKAFEKKTGLKVQALYDVEAQKTVGLVRKITSEMNNPQCDIFWNNEIVNTIKLKNMGALESYKSPNAAGIPDGFKDSEGYWTGFAARARVFIINTELLPDPAAWPSSYKNLVDPAWKGKGGTAKPLTGTTATHGAILFQVLPEAEARGYFEGLKENEVNLTSGNAHLMRLVRKGSFAFGFTDSDDFNVARVDAGNYPVAAVYPDQGEGEPGTLVLPNTVAMIKGGPNPEAARKLIDYILSPEVEEKLAYSDSAQIPLHPGVKKPDYVKVPGKDFRPMAVDFEKAAEDYDHCQEFFRELFIR